jgi:hypothetical protein
MFTTTHPTDQHGPPEHAQNIRDEHTANHARDFI